MCMNKKCTLLTAAFMVASVFTASAAQLAPPTIGAAVPSTGWAAGKYYFLQTGTTSYLSLSGERADSVIIKSDFTSLSKASLDSALWQITSVPGETSTDVYQFENKKTKAILSFAASQDATSKLASGIDKWVFAPDGTISANNGGKPMTLSINAGKLVFTGGTVAKFTVIAPNKSMVMKAADLGDGFRIFQLSFDATYEGNIFSGKDIIATQVGSTDFVTLQAKGDESFDDGTKKFFGVDTLKTEITNATGAYGAKFVLDSTYTVNDKHTVANADFQQFKFTIDLMNDSLGMSVKNAPSVNGTLATLVPNVQVVYASLASTKVLTVGATDQGAAPLITVKKGTPATIPTGTGVYFLKSASKTATAGQYLRAYDLGVITMGDSVPTAFQAKGQWYIKDNGGMYSIVDRNTNTAIILNEQIFAVQGMANTYTFGNNADSITVVASTADFTNKFLGTRRFTKDEMANNAYALNLISGTSGVENLYVTSADSMLQVKSGSASEAIDLKLVVSADSVKYATTSMGAQALGDTLYFATYTLKDQFSTKVVALDLTKSALKLTSFVPANVFTFNAAATGDKYTMTTTDKDVSLDINTSNLILTGNVAYFKFVSVEAPEYASVTDGHKMFMANAQYLAMNPLNFWAESKSEGQAIVKADYNKDNFAFWVAKAKASTDVKPLYWISKIDPASEIKDNTAPRYYMVSFADSTAAKYTAEGAPRVGFVSRDTITTMENSPALFALKTTEDGGYLLENQRDLNSLTAVVKKPYVSIVNSFVVMSSTGIPFAIENTSGPVANDKIETTDVVVTASVGTVTVKNAAGKKVILSNILGQSLGSYNVTSDLFTVPASRGIVIATVTGNGATENVKVLVK